MSIRGERPASAQGFNPPAPAAELYRGDIAAIQGESMTPKQFLARLKQAQNDDRQASHRRQRAGRAYPLTYARELMELRERVAELEAFEADADREPALFADLADVPRELDPLDLVAGE